MSDREPRAVWVTSDVNPDGSAGYIVTVSATDDVALSLKADAAVRYVATATRAAVIARHDAAVMHQLTTRFGLDPVTGAQAVADLRQDREPLNDAATAPLRFDPIVSGTTLRPYVHLWAGDTKISQWTPKDCLEHAGYVMEALAGADLDSAYYQYLRQTIGIDVQRARAVVAHLGDEDAGLSDPTPRRGPKRKGPRKKR